MSDYQKGLLWTSLGVLCLTPDALLVRLIGGEPWTLLFWRGILMSASLTIFLKLNNTPFQKLNYQGGLAALFLATSTTFFVFSLNNTHAANTLVIVATSPLLAGLASLLFLRERLPMATWLAIFVATGGVALSLADGWERGTLRGELFAAGSALAMACHFTALRWWRSPHGPLAIWAAGWLIAALALPWAAPFTVESNDWPYLFLLGGVVLPTAFGMMAVGPRYLPAPEVGLILLGETVLGPLWVWLVLHEEPGSSTLWGGTVVVGTLALHSLYRRSTHQS